MTLLGHVSRSSTLAARVIVLASACAACTVGPSGAGATGRADAAGALPSLDGGVVDGSVLEAGPVGDVAVSGGDAGAAVQVDAGPLVDASGVALDAVADAVVPLDASTPDATSSGERDAGSMPPARLPATDYDFEVVTEFVQDAPTFNLTRPSDMLATAFSMPVVVWANGGCLRSDIPWTPLFERWAKAGFFVLSLTGQGGAGDLFGMLGSTTKTEHRQLVDWVESQNQTGPYAGLLDLSRIIVAGNSCGGVTAIEAAAEDARIAGIFVLSGSSAVASTDAAIMAEVKVPLGFVVGNVDQDIAGANAVNDYAILPAGVPGMLVSRFEGDHVTVSTDPAILSEVAEIALDWMDLSLYGTRAAYDALLSAEVCANCTPGWWSLQSKSLDTLVR